MPLQFLSKPLGGPNLRHFFPSTRAAYHPNFVTLACPDHEISKPEVQLQYHSKPPGGPKSNHFEVSSRPTHLPTECVCVWCMHLAKVTCKDGSKTDAIGILLDKPHEGDGIQYILTEADMTFVSQEAEEFIDLFNLGLLPLAYFVNSNWPALNPHIHVRKLCIRMDHLSYEPPAINAQRTRCLTDGIPGEVKIGTRMFNITAEIYDCGTTKGEDYLMIKSNVCLPAQFATMSYGGLKRKNDVQTLRSKVREVMNRKWEWVSDLESRVVDATPSADTSGKRHEMPRTCQNPNKEDKAKTNQT
ncbi:hypothetical protein Bbelb_048860 [Branchiostoma belcheri]|nr:hypothetical protein Bbelb_048860 [Branchiostoma belcheri]